MDLYVEGINQAVKGKPADMVIGIHMCRGNYKGMYLSEGGYDSVAEKLFGGAQVNHFLLEFDTPRAGGFAPLRFLPKTKGVVLGMVCSKVPQLESLDTLKRRAAEAAKYVDSERLALSPQRGFASTIGGNTRHRGRRARETEALRRGRAGDLGLSGRVRVRGAGNPLASSGATGP